MIGVALLVSAGCSSATVYVGDDSTGAPIGGALVRSHTINADMPDTYTDAGGKAVIRAPEKITGMYVTKDGYTPREVWGGNYDTTILTLKPNPTTAPSK